MQVLSNTTKITADRTIPAGTAPVQLPFTHVTPLSRQFKHRHNKVKLIDPIGNSPQMAAVMTLQCT